MRYVRTNWVRENQQISVAGPWSFSSHSLALSEMLDEMLGRSRNWLCSMFLVHVCIGRPRALKPDPCASPPDLVCCTEMSLVAFLLDTGRWQSRANGSVGGTAIIRGSLVGLEHARAFRSVGSARAERARSIGSGPLSLRALSGVFCVVVPPPVCSTGNVPDCETHGVV